MVNASAKLFAWEVTMTAMATAIGPVGAGNLGLGAAKDRGKEPDGYRPVQSGERANAGRHAKGQRHRQAHHRRRYAAKDVAAQCLEVVAYSEGH